MITLLPMALLPSVIITFSLAIPPSSSDYSSKTFADPIISKNDLVDIQPIQTLPIPKAAVFTKLTKLTLSTPEPVKSPPKPAITINKYPAYPYQCTRFVKDMRPDVPNHLGNANLWFDKLKAMGWSVGYSPRPGAIGQSIKGVHVVYVMQVSGDQIYLAERNYDRQGSYRERWATASLFKYIYK